MEILICPRCQSDDLQVTIKTAGIGKLPTARRILKCRKCGKVKTYSVDDWETKWEINQHLEGYFDL